MSVQGVSISPNAYSALVEALLSILQAQVLQSLHLYEISKPWVSKFTEVYTKMMNFELKHPKFTKFTASCKELYEKVAFESSSKHSSRTNIPKSVDNYKVRSRPISIHRHISVSSWVDPGNTIATFTQRKKSTSKYYSKIMNNFLNEKSPTRSKSKKKSVGLEKDFWLLGDEIKFLG